VGIPKGVFKGVFKSVYEVYLGGCLRKCLGVSKLLRKIQYGVFMMKKLLNANTAQVHEYRFSIEIVCMAEKPLSQGTVWYRYDI
jgi:hypothetical protein